MKIVQRRLWLIDLSNSVDFTLIGGRERNEMEKEPRSSYFILRRSFLSYLFYFSSICFHSSYFKPSLCRTTERVNRTAFLSPFSSFFLFFHHKVNIWRANTSLFFLSLFLSPLSLLLLLLLLLRLLLLQLTFFQPFQHENSDQPFKPW